MQFLAPVLLLLLPLCTFAPGFWLVRRFRWTPIETLCGSVGLSLILLYLAAGILYVFARQHQTAGYFAVSALCAVAALASWRDIARLWRSLRVRRTLVAFGFLLLWTLTVLSMIRVYSGGTWMGDWLEHFQRCLYFLQGFPLHTAIFENYQLPARPPLMNLVGAFFLGQTADRFELFQLIFTFLNLLVFLPAVLILPALAGRGCRLRASSGHWPFSSP